MNLTIQPDALDVVVNAGGFRASNHRGQTLTKSVAAGSPY
jgi:hypothetical protein